MIRPGDVVTASVGEDLVAAFVVRVGGPDVVIQETAFQCRQAVAINKVVRESSPNSANPTSIEKKLKLMRQQIVRWEDRHFDVCDECHYKDNPKLGELLMCETCMLCYHLQCCTPPLHSLPNVEYQCHECRGLPPSTELFALTRDKIGIFMENLLVQPEWSRHRDDMNGLRLWAFKNKWGFYRHPAPLLGEIRNFIAQLRKPSDGLMSELNTAASDTAFGHPEVPISTALKCSARCLFTYPPSMPRYSKPVTVLCLCRLPYLKVWYRLNYCSAKWIEYTQPLLIDEGETSVMLLATTEEGSKVETLTTLYKVLRTKRERDIQ